MREGVQVTWILAGLHGLLIPSSCFQTSKEVMQCRLWLCVGGFSAWLGKDGEEEGKAKGISDQWTV